MTNAFTNATNATVSGARRYKRSILIVSGAIQVGVGGLLAAAPHLATVLAAKPFAITMIVGGVVSGVLAFVNTQLQQEEAQ